jgi:hypothetical protein
MCAFIYIFIRYDILYTQVRRPQQQVRQLSPVAAAAAPAAVTTPLQLAQLQMVYIIYSKHTHAHAHKHTLTQVTFFCS